MNTFIRKSQTGFLLGFVLCGMAGCEAMSHKLHPSQLWKLNRGPELGRDSYNFSVPPASQEELLQDLVKKTESGLTPHSAIQE